MPNEQASGGRGVGVGVVKPEASMSCVRSVSYQIDSISLMASGMWDVGCGRRHQVMRQKAIFIYQEQSEQRSRRRRRRL